MGGYWRFGHGGGGSQGGGGCGRPTTTICILPGGLCVWGFGVWRDVGESTGTTLEQGKISECKILTPQQTTFV